MDPVLVSSSEEDVTSEDDVAEDASLSPDEQTEIQRVREVRQASDERQELKAFRDVEDRLLARVDRENARKRSRSLIPSQQVCF